MNRVFISYSGDRIDRALLFRALRDHGLNPWRDVESQSLGDPTTEVIEDELATCSAAIVWINPTILTSAYVAKVELPAIIKAARKRGLRVVPVFDEMSPEEASNAISSATGFELGDMNGHRVNPLLSPEANAAEIGQRLVRAHVHDAQKRGDPPVVRLISYDNTADLREKAVLNFDWRHRLASGRLEPTDEASLRSALATAAEALKENYGPCEVVLAVKAHFALAVALGAAFAQPTGCRLRLHRPGEEDWTTISAYPSTGGLLQQEENPKGPLSVRAASLEVSVSRDIEPGVNAYVSAGTRYRHRLMLMPPEGPGRGAVDGAERAGAWAHQIGSVLTTLADRPDVDRIDLFLAVPVEIAVMVGWWANAVGRVDVMNWDDKIGPYRRMWSLP